MSSSLNLVFSLRHKREEKLKRQLKRTAKKIVSIFSRGNTNLQKGAYVTRADKDAILKDLLKKFRDV